MTVSQTACVEVRRGGYCGLLSSDCILQRYSPSESRLTDLRQIELSELSAD